MGIQSLRQKAQQEAAQKQAELEAKQARGGLGSKFVAHLVPAGIAQHKLFAPMLAIWGAAVFGLSALALPSAVTARAVSLTGLGNFGSLGALALAAVAALLGALIGSSMARAAGRFTHGSQPPVPATKDDEAPESDEKPGTISHDIDDVLEAAELLQSEDLKLEEVPAPDLSDEAGEDTQTEPLDPPLALEPEIEDATEAIALDLGEFDELLDAQSPAPSEPEAVTGIQMLRQTPPADLSLVQLVERFAAALRDLQDASTPRAKQVEALAQGPEGERALNQALQALEGMTRSAGTEVAAEAATATGSGASAAPTGAVDPSALKETEQELRVALSRLQALSGAA
ncbi:MAG: hypothetical protein AAFW59_00285 [Pseudomonadota bacterium]